MWKLSLEGCTELWRFLSELLQDYPPAGREWASICETRRLVEVYVKEHYTRVEWDEWQGRL